jgi:phosphoribosylformylglycinamidine cyclo-ligase
MDYKTSGVDIEAGNAFVEKLREKAPGIGGFGGMFKVPDGYSEPVLVSGTDGVGTKINICRVANDYTTIGQDLVAMCVNDIITCGAKPLYFLDYVSTQKIDDNVADIMVGILKGCELADVELIGGETAEHFRQREYDLAGFCTGLVEKKKIIDGSSIKPSDIVIGLESSGLHSNGYTLINDMLWRHKIFYKGGYEESFGEDIRDISPTPELLTPTRIYTSVVKRLLDEVDTVYGMAHITGGGIPENLPRCLPEGLTVRVDYNSWPLPDIFKKIQLAGEIDEEEMKRVFNLGIGYCVIVPANTVELTRDIIRDEGIDCWEIGEVYE